MKKPSLTKLFQPFIKILRINKWFIVLCFTTTLIFMFSCTFLHDSLFYIKSKNIDKAKKYMKIKNTKRLLESQEFINEWKRTRTLSSENVDIGLTIITVARNEHNTDHYQPNYLTQVVGKLLSLLNSTSHHKSYKIFLCNVDSDPVAFNEIKPLTKLLTTFQRFNHKVKMDISIFEKEKQDYLYCLNETMKRNVTYTFMLEDDAYPENNLVPVLEYILEYRVENKFTKVQALKRNITYVKFYHLPSVLGYISFEIERIPELISLSLFLGTIFSQIYLHIVKRTQLSKHIIWFLWVLYACFLIIGIGRPNLLELRRISKYLYVVSPTPSCCTPAMLYTQYGGHTVLNLMKDRTCKAGYGKDTLLDDIRRKHKLKALMVQPNLFSHIGRYSTLRDTKLNVNDIL